MKLKPKKKYVLYYLFNFLALSYNKTIFNIFFFIS